MRIPVRRRAATLGVVASILLFGAIALAQDTGGSFGGGDFGGGGSSDTGGGGSFGGGSDYGGSSDYGGGTTYTGGGGSGGGGGGDFFCCLLFGAIVFAVVFITSARRAPQGLDVQVGSHAPVGGMDVSAIRIALDHRARPILQQKLDGLARSPASRSKAGLATALHEVCIELRRSETAWLYANVENSPMVAAGSAEATFRRIASDARSRFRVETVRALDGQVRTQEDTATRDRGEGPGIVVVTVVVAARRHLVDIRQPEDARALHELLAGFGSVSANDLVALEIIWSPSAEDDRMTVEEMQRLYPELRRIRDDTVVSRIFCGYCSSPFWSGHSRCPHCGAPATDGRPAAGSGTPQA